MLIVKVPAINGFGRTNGCEKAPGLIERRFKGKFLEIKVNNLNIKESQEKILNEARKFFLKNKRILFLGGDHSISFPLVRAFSQKNSGCLVVLDSHADSMPSMKEPSHEEWLSAFLKFKNIPVFLIGTKQIFQKEKKELTDQKVSIIPFNRVGNIDNVIKKINQHKKVYFSLDLDVFSSDVFNAVAYPQKRGLNLKQVLKLIKKIKPYAMDIVEFNPKKDKNDKNVKILKEIIKCVVSLR